MSIHVCKCIHSGREEYHLRYPGMTEAAAQELADEINGGALSYAKRYKEEQARRRAEVGAGTTADKRPNVEVQGPGAASLRTVPCNDGLEGK